MQNPEHHAHPERDLSPFDLIRALFIIKVDCHRLMLEDTVRTDAYKAAVEALAPGKKVRRGA